MNPLTDLPPWLGVPFFGTPTETTVSLTANAAAVQVAGGNPHRVGLLFAGTSAGQMAVSTLADLKFTVGTANHGIGITPTNPYAWFSWYTHGPMVCLPWYGASAFNGAMTVIELIAWMWPGDATTERRVAAPPRVAAPQDYWPDLQSGRWRQSPTYRGDIDLVLPPAMVDRVMGGRVR